MPGLFVVLEGPDGAGTSRHSRTLSERLESEGHSVLLTAEPSSGSIGIWIRTLLKGTEPIAADALQLLFCADRAEHILSVIRPALEAGTHVICDRYLLSTIIYGGAQGIDPDWLSLINQKFPKPDLELLLLPPFEVCQERLSRRQEKDMFEGSEMQRLVYDRYTAYAAEHTELTAIDTSGETSVVADHIRTLISF